MNKSKKYKKDICLFGWYCKRNIGGSLTFFALHQLLKSAGFSVYVVQNQNVKELTEFEQIMFDVVKDKYILTKLRNNAKLDELSQFADYFVVASDQLWRATYAFKPKLFFLECGDESVKKISVATSFGVKNHEFTPEQYEVAKTAFGKFSNISVREPSGIDILNEMGIAADCILDPVFLCDINEYTALEPKSSKRLSGDFLFTYILDASAEKAETIRDYGEKLNLKRIFGVQTPGIRRLRKFKWINQLYNSSSADFIYNLRRAKFVITDSYHCACFCTMFKIPFVIIKNETRGTERLTLFENLGLSDRIIVSGDISKEINNINWNEIYKNLDVMKEKSYHWLENAFGREFVRFDNKIFPPKNCTGCSACVNVCPKNCISLAENNEKFLYPVVNDKCVNCGLCEKICPVLRDTKQEKTPEKSFALMAADEIREKSSSGGAFNLLANYFLKNNGYVCGAVFDDNFQSVKHIVSNLPEDIAKMQNSKYIQSELGNIFKEIKTLLSENKKVLFTGTPCQVAGLKAYIGKNENLFTVDLVCHGVPSKKIWQDYLYENYYGKKLVGVNFRSKEKKGWVGSLKLEFENEIVFDTDYMKLYLSNNSLRESCYNCLFTNTQRVGDLTIGDFWKIDKFGDETLNDHKGTSLVLSNTPKGENLLNIIKEQSPVFKEVPLEFAIKGNPILKRSSPRPTTRGEFYKDKSINFPVNTPAYVIDFEKIENNCKILQSIITATNCKILLAQKAFSCYELYPTISKYLDGTTASGLNEALLSDKYFKKENHIFAPAYTDKEFAEIVKICQHISFNSLGQFNKFKDKINGQKVFLRVNPLYSEIETEIYNPCRKGSRLGITPDKLTDFDFDGVDGLHFHTMCEQNSDVLKRTLEQVEKHFGAVLPKMKYLNMGGGHHITRKGYDIPLLIERINYFQNKYNLTVYLEPGEAVALGGGYLVATVLDIVDENVILDTSAACHMPDVLEMPYTPPVMNAAYNGKYFYRFGGNTCLAGDIIGEYTFDNPLNIGDKVVFKDMAIYSIVKNNTFNGINLPSIYLLKDGEISILKTFGFKDFEMRI